MSKIDLIHIIISEKNKKTAQTPEDNDLTKEKANELLRNNNFTRKEIKESTPTEIKTRPKLT